MIQTLKIYSKVQSNSSTILSAIRFSGAACKKYLLKYIGLLNLLNVSELFVFGSERKYFIIPIMLSL